MKPLYALRALLLATSLSTATSSWAQMELFADRVVRDSYGEITADGDVEAIRSDEVLTTEHLRYDPLKKEVFAEGHVQLHSPQADISATAARLHTVNHSGELQQATVALPEGKYVRAARLKRLDETRLSGDHVSFTECPPDAPAWRLRASHVEIDQQAGDMIVSDARFELGGIPVFYSPYWQYPLRRRSGVLMPQISTSQRRGTAFALPLYVAPSASWDATYTPRWMTRRGWMNDVELRHRSTVGQETWQLAWLQDRVTQRRRYHVTGTMQEQLPLGLQFRLDANQTSDYQYLSDYAVDGTQASARFITSKASLGWQGPWGGATLLAQKQQDLIQASNEKTLQWLPRLESNWSLPIYADARLHLDQQLTHFARPLLLSGWRSWLHPWLEVPFAPLGGAVEFRLQSGLYQWNYWQLKNHPHSSVRARAYASSAEASVHLERISQNHHWRHSISPTLRYDLANAPDQSTMPNFDSGFARLTMNNLLQGNRFTGLDRVQRLRRFSALLRNALQYKDTENQRKWTIMTLDVGMSWDVLRNSVDARISPTPSRSYGNVLVDYSLSPTPQFTMAADGQYDVAGQYWAVANASLRMDHEDGHHLSLGWQHTDRRYVAHAINLVSVDVAARFYRRWHADASWQYDSSLKLTQQATISAGYVHPCWNLSIEGFRINRRGSTGNSDYGFRFTLGFKGLGNVGGT